MNCITLLIASHNFSLQSHRSCSYLEVSLMYLANRIPLIAMLAAMTVASPVIAQTTAPAAPAAAAPAAAPPPPPPILPLQEAVLSAAKALFSNAQLGDRNESKINVVIDPLIDGASGAQTYSSARMRFQLMDIVKKDFPRFDVKPFNTQSVNEKPLLLVGTFTAINAAGQATGPRDAYRICLALADLKTGKIISKGLARANPDGVNPKPLSAFVDSPVWANDDSVTGYITTCQGTKAGDVIKPAYLQRIASSAILSDAIRAYEFDNYQKSFDLYKKAAAEGGGEQLRILNGLYLNSVKLNRKKDAEEAFAKLVDYGVKAEKLSVKLLFKPGAGQFVANTKQTNAYPMWLRQIAKRSNEGGACMEVVGHTSPTGQLANNEKLSQARAEYVKSRLAAVTPSLDKRLSVKGVASKENIIGTGKDDESDALDRRVEFKVAKCV
jgi:outer membrane protein OmpA-like peptidoglycan-associated protein